MKAGEVTRNVATLAELPRASRQKVRPWEPEHLGAFLDATADERLAPLFHVCAFAGLRRGEACGLKWSAADLDRARLIVNWQRTTARHRVVEGPQKTAESENAVDLDAGTVDVLRTWRRQQVAARLAWARRGSTLGSCSPVRTVRVGTPTTSRSVSRRWCANTVHRRSACTRCAMLRHR